jgi:hypothetical protein
MKDDSNIAVDLDQIDEGILTYGVSDEALEAAAGRGDLCNLGCVNATGSIFTEPFDLGWFE